MHAVRLAAGTIALATLCRAAIISVDFESFGLPPHAALPYTGGFTAGGIAFANSWTTWGAFTSWNGFAISTGTNTVTPGYLNQFSAWSGGGAEGTSHYLIGYDDGFSLGPDMVMTFATDVLVHGLYLNNTTYTGLAIRDGDDGGFGAVKKFGGPSGTDPDWYVLYVAAYDASSTLIGTNEFYLADYRFSNSTNDYVISTWTWMDLTGFGPTVRKLEFTLNSSDVGLWGINTPTYVAMDQIKYTVIPEPATFGLLAVALTVAAVFRPCRAKVAANAPDASP
ncbi:MAG: DUF4465 domain-containing protein [Kiritimatiellae bacterium]|nr:DUF4465 domain-containing protein [Kiritimatiellia bacterium]